MTTTPTSSLYRLLSCLSYFSFPNVIIYITELNVFQIPKPVLTDIGVPFPGTTQDIQEFSIRNVHTGSRISALCWATNGERLFSGDTGGRLVMSVVDFFKNTVQTSLMSVESGQILTLSYLHRTLLVSSAWETAVVDLSRLLL